MSFFTLLFLFYVGDNVEFKYGVGHSHYIALHVHVVSNFESIYAMGGCIRLPLIF